MPGFHVVKECGGSEFRSIRSGSLTVVVCRDHHLSPVVDRQRYRVKDAGPSGCQPTLGLEVQGRLRSNGPAGNRVGPDHRIGLQGLGSAGGCQPTAWPLVFSAVMTDPYVVVSVKA